MSWADRAIKDLQDGKSTVIKPHGASMKPIVESGATVTLDPVSSDDVNIGDVVLSRVSGNVYLHLVKAKDAQGRVQIGNNRGGINGWTKAVYGRAVEIDNSTAKKK